MFNNHANDQSAMDEENVPLDQAQEVDQLDADLEWETIDGIKEASFILKCIQSTFPGGEPVFDVIDRGRMTKVLMRHIRGL